MPISHLQGVLPVHTGHNWNTLGDLYCNTSATSFVFVYICACMRAARFQTGIAMPWDPQLQYAPPQKFPYIKGITLSRDDVVILHTIYSVFMHIMYIWMDGCSFSLF